MPMCPPKIEEWYCSKNTSILEDATQRIGSDSPELVFMYLYNRPQWIMYTAFIKSDCSFLALLDLLGILFIPTAR